MRHRWFRPKLLGAFLLGASCLAAWSAPQPVSAQTLALVGGTVIDGNGGPALVDATVVITDGRITAVGPSRSIQIPAGARQLDSRGKYLTPGFIDANVHVTSWQGGATDTPGWEQRYVDEALAAVRNALARGVTTARDTYGYLPALLAVRDSLRKHLGTGTRLLVAGPIIGWDSDTRLAGDGSPFADGLEQGMGEDTQTLPPEALRARLTTYLDKGVDLIKIGVTPHAISTAGNPMLFSPEALKVMVTEAHRRGLPVDVHAGGPEAIRAAVEAGVDVIQHADISLDVAAEPETQQALIKLLAERRVICVINVPVHRPAMARALIHGGCVPALASDDYSTFGEVFIAGLPSAVTDLGMTPAEVIVAATRNGALASKALDKYGTIEPGKMADILIFAADPQADIGNIRTLERVISEGHIVER